MDNDPHYWVTPEDFQIHCKSKLEIDSGDKVLALHNFETTTNTGG